MTKQMTWGRHFGYEGGQWIKLFESRDINQTKARIVQGSELRMMLSTACFITNMKELRLQI